MNSLSVISSFALGLGTGMILTGGWVAYICHKTMTQRSQHSADAMETNAQARKYWDVMADLQTRQLSVLVGIADAIEDRKEKP